ncbi:hypothetical protein IAD21_03074 [Abditibacteriota bacterium]|nr:hypothetical protein IAD21_03074 [Abditibacteriota bacterium]
MRTCNFGVFAFIFLFTLVSNANAQDNAMKHTGTATTVSMNGLMDEMVSPDSVARWPAPAFTVRQASSYDRARVAPDKPGWFANSDSSNYIRIEEHNGRQERVMMDADGPGVIVRFFLTNSGALANRIRIYLDNATEPAIEWPSSDLMDGDLKVGSPLLSRHPAPLGHGGATLYLPIPYAHHCKVTLEEKDPAHAGGHYYHVDYRSYPPDTTVETFTRAILDNARPKIARVNQLLQTPPTPPVTKSVRLNRMLEAEGEATIDLPTGPSAVRQLELSVGADLPPAACEQALRSIIIRGTFDGEHEAIWCPVGDFIGSGTGGRPLKSWYRTVDEHGNAICRWTMPYQKSGSLTLQNLGNQNVPVKLMARVGPWTWDDRSLYFHCNWHQQVQIPARPLRDWNFATVKGRGVLVGDVMSVYNPLPSWYGEGNEKIWVDGESFPSHVGTGTEDYYNASWAPNPIYQTPFTNQPRIDDPLSQGQNVYTRSRNLDTVPFTQSLQFDFEISTWKDSKVDYATTTYWYGAPGASSNVAPQPVEARRPLQILPPPLAVQGALEIEALPVVGKAEGLVVEPQDMRSFTGTWSANAHLLIRGKQVGDYVEVAIPVTGSAPRRVTLYATRAYDYGILKFTVNGQPVSNNFDGYAPDPTPLIPIPLGVFTPKNGQLTLRAELVGTNPASGGFRYLAALDAVVVSQ